MNFEEPMQRLLEDCPGAQGAAIVDPDGIPVVVTPREGSLETLGVELATILRDLAEAAREFQHGRLEQCSVFAEDAIIILTTITGGYFLVLVMGRDGLAGKGRFQSRLAGARLYSEFI
ncbi:MAG: roadblock/LC7 domain-containing protein [Acidobacteria bacterium]|nr:roadblock/LC7 domain-containing protein [Candidatus Sulfomarinibacter sp. MAG AM1]